jgi:hypothetical protein
MPASPRTVELLRTAMVPAPAGELSSRLADALIAGLPRMLFIPSSTLLRHTATIDATAATAAAAAAAAAKLPTVEVELKNDVSKGKIAGNVQKNSSPHRSSGEVGGEFIRTSAVSVEGQDMSATVESSHSHSPASSMLNDPWAGSGPFNRHGHNSSESSALVAHVGRANAGTTSCAADATAAAARSHAAAEGAVAPVASAASTAATLSCTVGTGSPSPSAAEDANDKLQVLRKEECGHIPELFLCPISREVMENPVLASDGHVYERSQIESWLQEHDTSPMTNIAMRPEVAPVLSLRSEIQDFKQRFPHLI